MKLSYKIGAIAITSTVEAHDIVTRAVTARNGITLDTPEVKEVEKIPAKTIEFHMQESHVEIDCEVGEVAGVYKELVPMFKDMMDAFVAIRNSAHSRDVAVAAGEANAARAETATAAFMADQLDNRGIHSKMNTSVTHPPETR